MPGGGLNLFEGTWMGSNVFGQSPQKIASILYYGMTMQWGGDGA